MLGSEAGGEERWRCARGRDPCRDLATAAAAPVLRAPPAAPAAAQAPAAGAGAGAGARAGAGGATMEAREKVTPEPVYDSNSRSERGVRIGCRGQRECSVWLVWKREEGRFERRICRAMLASVQRYTTLTRSIESETRQSTAVAFCRSVVLSAIRAWKSMIRAPL